MLKKLAESMHNISFLSQQDVLFSHKDQTSSASFSTASTTALMSDRGIR